MSIFQFVKNALRIGRQERLRKAINDAIMADGDSTEELTRILRSKVDLNSVLSECAIPVMVAEPVGALFTQHGSGIPPILVAAMYYKPARTRLLLDRGSSTEIAGSDGRTPLQLAIAGVPDMEQQAMQMALLHQGEKIAGGSGDAPPAIRPELQAASLETTRVLLEYGANANARNALLSTVLRVACMFRGKAEHVRLLLDHGAEVNGRSAADFTPLMVAAASGLDDLVQVLLEHGADPNLVDLYRRAALHAASANGHPRTAELLLACGARTNVCDEMDATPLHHACAHGHGEVVELLLAAGADPNGVDKGGYTAMDLAASQNATSIMECLRAHGTQATCERPARLDERREGSTPDRAIVVQSVHEEYEWLARNHPGCKFLGQKLDTSDDPPLDILTWRGEDGTENSVYFDISSFYGRQ